MIWRLMASILTLSEPGGAVVNTDSTDWPDQFQCEQIRKDFYTPPAPQTLNGKRITIKISAACVPVGGELPPIDGVPPPPIAPPPPAALLPPRALPRAPPPAVMVEPWDGPYYGPSPLAPSIYDEDRLYRRGDLPPWQRLAPY